MKPSEIFDTPEASGFSRITELPDDILRIVDAENWERVFDEYMTTGTPNSEIEAQYMWKPHFMKEFIRTIITNMKHEHH